MLSKSTGTGDRGDKFPDYSDHKGFVSESNPVTLVWQSFDDHQETQMILGSLYGKLEGLEEDVLISQDVQRVECRRWVGGDWETVVYKTGDRTVQTFSTFAELRSI